ncbi:MAG: hypothetical protein EOP53_14600, partial [Sphingobacteriales bacterium]
MKDELYFCSFLDINILAMSKIFTLLLCVACFVTKAKANYTTPGTGVSWTLTELAANSGGNISVQDGVYVVAGNIIISAGDAITINNNATLRFAAGNLWQVYGSFWVDPPTGVLFTAQDPVQG